MRPSADARNITLDVRLDPSASHSSFDPTRIQQVIWNLLSNAVKFTPKGGHIHITLAREHSSSRIDVSDSGQGIPAEELPYLFDRFRQTNSGPRRKHSGLGLGLSIVKYLVEAHGGTVEAHSPGEGRGATFTIRLPIRAVQGEEDDPPDPPRRRIPPPDPLPIHRQGPPSPPPKPAPASNPRPRPRPRPSPSIIPSSASTACASWSSMMKPTPAACSPGSSDKPAPS